MIRRGRRREVGALSELFGEMGNEGGFSGSFRENRCVWPMLVQNAQETGLKDGNRHLSERRDAIIIGSCYVGKGLDGADSAHTGS